MNLDAFDAFAEEELPQKENIRKRKAEQTDPPRKEIKAELRADEEVIQVDYKFDKNQNPLVASGNQELVISHKVRHQVALPKDYPYVPLANHIALDPPARIYPFVLDPFQKVAIQSIERGMFVLIR